MKYAKALRGKDLATVYSLDDPIFTGYLPDFQHSAEGKNDLSIHPEIRKMLFSTLPQPGDSRFPMRNEEDA